MEDFQDLFFELSSDERYSILLLLNKKPLTLSEISREKKITTQEVSRHTARLIKTGLINKEANRRFSISPYGALILKLVDEFQFIVKNRDYFSTHVVTQLPIQFVERFGELKFSNQKNIIDFLHFVNQIIKDADEFVWLCVDQYPVTAIESIKEALGRKVKFRVIEPEGASRPELILETPEEALALAGTRRLPLGQQRTVKKIDIFLAVTDSKCAFAFPGSGGQFDYVGFTSSHEGSVRWCSELFERFWFSHSNYT